MTGFKELFDEGKLAAVQAVAYPDQNRSHFRSTDIWQTGSSSQDYVTSGWMGRYFDKNYPGYPDDYPNEDHPDPFAITLQYTVSETCQGSASNYSMALTDPFNVGQVDESTIENLPDNNFGNEMAFLINAIAQTNAYSETIVEAANKGANLSTKYDPGSPLAQQLKTVALLISGGLQTRVYVVRIGGFDTHASQVELGSTTSGTHAELLSNLSNAINAFQDDLQKQGLEKRVMGMTFSEFGRQIKSNDSLGTDHGTAAPLFMFGSCVQGGIVGSNPDIPAQLQPQAGVEMQFDYRQVYTSILKNWFGVEDSEANELLFGNFDTLPIIQGCETSSIDGPYVEPKPYAIDVYPNPITQTGNINFNSKGERLVVGLYDQLGRKVRAIADREFSPGRHSLEFSVQGLPKGMYTVSIAGVRSRESARVVK
jgi:uncharacterized protein (DUF1501 family)